MIKNAMSQLSTRSGQLALAAFWLATISGIFLIGHFDINNPAESLLYLQNQNPSGLFLHSLHYWGAQICIIFTIVHFFEKIRQPISSSFWKMAIWTLPILFLTMITGYIIKGDAHGQLAYNILYNLLNQIPVLGYLFSRLLTMPNGSLMPLYIYHVSVLTTGCILTIFLHSKNLFFSNKYFLNLWVPVFFISLALPPIIVTNFNTIPRSPWYLLPIQEYLHFMPYPVIIMLLFLSFFILLLFLPRISNRMRDNFKKVMLLFAAIYISTILFVTLIRSNQWQAHPSKAIWNEKMFHSPTIYIDALK